MFTSFEPPSMTWKG